MIRRVEDLDPDRDACLALSGGVDSVTTLFAMLEAGRKPRCYTFYAKGHESRDLVSSKALCDHFGLEHVTVPVPVDHDTIVNDVRWLVPRVHKLKKTIIQCCHPWMYTYPEMQSRGDKHILIGFAAGNFYALSRKANKLLRKIGEKDYAAQGHRGHFFARSQRNLQYVDANVAALGLDYYDILMDDFYACDEIRDWLLQFTIAEIHQDEHGNRFEKAPAIYAFEDYYKQGAFYRKGEAYQVCSGIRDFHDGLLWNPKYNPNDRKAIIGIYNDIRDGVI